MQAEFWLQRWQERQIGFHQDAVNSYLLEHWASLQLPVGSRVLVPLCGKSRDMLWLLEQGYEVVGIELSVIAVQEFFAEWQKPASQKQVGKLTKWQQDGLTIYCGDLFDLTQAELGKIDAVYDRAALIALPETMRVDYVLHINQITTCVPHLLVTMEYSSQEMNGPPFAVDATEVQNLYHKTHVITQVYTHDILSDNPRFKERGLTSMVEMVYILQPV